ncbi:MAG TPA: ABC transporter permease [Gemmatimonadales bacterium]
MSRARRQARDVMVSLAAQRSRVILMMAGMVAATAVLSAVMVTGQGARAQVMELVRKHGLDMLMVRAGGEVQVFAPRTDRGLAVLVEEDARAIEAEVPNVEMVSVVQNQRGITVVHQDRSLTTRAFGVEDDWVEIRRWGMAEGEFVSPADLSSMGRVVMLGARVARELFPQGGAVGQTVRVNHDPYTVKGVFIDMGASAGGDDWDDRIVLPFTTTERRLFGRPYLEQIVIRVSNPRRLPETAQQIRSLVRVRHHIAAGEPDDFFVREPEDVQNAALETSSTLSSLLLAVSLVALVAGGIVIMNLTLLSVSQRRQEIGLRRAVGARAADISRHFLLESLFVSLGGGAIGTLLGIAVALILAQAGMAASRLSWVPFAVAFGVCAAVGIAFGLHPARQAARIDPARALREGRA